MSVPESNPLRVALYARVSTEDQADRGTIQAQLALLRSLAQTFGWIVVGEYVDDGISGTIPIDQRPEGRRLLDEVGAGLLVHAVVAYRLDRLGRSLRALLDAYDALDRAGVTIRSATEPFDTSTPIGKFLFQLLASLAELEKSTISERTTMGRDRVARDGKWTGGPVPFGYDVDRDGSLSPSGRLVPGIGMTESDAVRELYGRITAGSSATEEARRLNALGVPSLRRYGNGKGAVHESPGWGVRRVCQMIHNPIYRGVHLLRSRHATVERPAPALVSPELWEAANQQLTRNRTLARRNAKRTYLLRGLVICGNCGTHYVGVTTTTRGTWSARYYRCNDQSGHLRPQARERCRAKLVRAEVLEDLVWQDCRQFVLNPGEALAEAQRQLRERMAEAVALEPQRRALTQRLAEKERERERIMTLFRRNRISLDEVERQLDHTTQESADLRQLLEGLKTQEDLALTLEAHLTDAAALLGQLGERLSEIEQEDDEATKRQVIESLVTRVTVRTEGTGYRKQAAIAAEYAFGQPQDHAVNSRTARLRGRRARAGRAGPRSRGGS